MKGSANLIRYIVLVLVIKEILKFHQIRPGKKQEAFFGYFRLSEGYTYLRTPIVNPFLPSF